MAGEKLGEEGGVRKGAGYGCRESPEWRVALHEMRRALRQCATEKSTASVPMTG